MLWRWFFDLAILIVTPLGVLYYFTCTLKSAVFCLVKEQHAWQMGDFCPLDANSCNAWPQVYWKKKRTTNLEVNKHLKNMEKKTKQKLCFLYLLCKEMVRHKSECFTCGFQLNWVLQFFVSSYTFFVCILSGNKKKRKVGVPEWLSSTEALL